MRSIFFVIHMLILFSDCILHHFQDDCIEEQMLFNDCKGEGLNQWPKDDLVQDNDLLSYVTPLKKQSSDKQYSSAEKQVHLHDDSQDSLFDKVDHLVEKECSVKVDKSHSCDSSNFDTDAHLSIDNHDAKPITKNKDNTASLIKSTPKSGNNRSTFASKLRKRYCKLFYLKQIYQLPCFKSFLMI